MIERREIGDDHHMLAFVTISTEKTWVNSTLKLDIEADSHGIVSEI